MEKNHAAYSKSCQAFASYSFDLASVLEHAGTLNGRESGPIPCHVKVLNNLSDSSWVAVSNLWNLTGVLVW